VPAEPPEPPTEIRQPDPATALADITELTFNQWRHHPVTKVFLQFLAEQEENHWDVAKHLFLIGQGGDVKAQEIRGRIMVLMELRDLTYPSMAQFYADKTDAAIASQSGT